MAKKITHALCIRTTLLHSYARFTVILNPGYLEVQHTMITLAFHIQRKVPLRCNHATMNIEETFAGTPPVMRKEKGRGNFYHPQIKAI